MPGARDVEGQDAREIETEKVCDFGAIVLCGASQKRLQGKETAITRKNQAHDAARGQDHVVRRTERNALILSTVPAQEIPSAKCRQQQPDAAQQSDQREDSSRQWHLRWRDCDQRLRRPIV